ncbi:MAG: hypothetical protein IPO00_03620 [Betaproteobacteria bacterium]|nr:hypothetical protein [Betaproteobacteria bacterium]
MARDGSWAAAETGSGRPAACAKQPTPPPPRSAWVTASEQRLLTEQIASLPASRFLAGYGRA